MQDLGQMLHLNVAWQLQSLQVYAPVWVSYLLPVAKLLVVEQVISICFGIDLNKIFSVHWQ